ncbi:MAG: hypothetical protein AAB649_07470, partial [Patescibacteria group bacterium]
MIFPKRKFDSVAISRKLNQAFKDTVHFKEGLILGYPGSPPLKESSESFKKFIDLHSNNIGTHTRIDSEAGWKGTQDLERETIFMIGDLLGAKNDKDIDGYISSG